MPLGVDYHLDADSLEARVALGHVFKYDIGTLSELPGYAFYQHPENPEAPRVPLGHFFHLIGGIPVVSRELKDLLSTFQLGATKFYSLPLFENDRTTRRPEEFYVLHVDEVKETFDAENSSSVERVGESNFYGATNLSQVALKDSACLGADLWREARLQYVWFFSDRLKRALEQSGFLDKKYPRLSFIPCNISS